MNDPGDLITAVAALWGAAAGALLPRAAYRFCVPAAQEGEERQGWRRACPAGHPVRGWLGPARCRTCAQPHDHHAQAHDSREQAHDPHAQAHDSREQAHDPHAQAYDSREQAHDSRAQAYDFREQAYHPRAQAYGPRAWPLALVTAALCAALAAATGTRPELGVWLLLAPVGVLLALVDVRVQRLPDPLTLPLAGAAAALLGLAALLPEHAGHWTTALLGALALGGGYFLLFLINPAGMAFGDVKLALGTGAVLGWYGWPTLLLGTFAGFVFGALYGGFLVVVRRAGRRTAIAFGPFMLAGAFAGVLVGAYTA